MSNMTIILGLESDSDNSQPGEVSLRRGTNRPKNLVIEIPDRQLEIDMTSLTAAIGALNGAHIASFVERLRELQKKARTAAEWDAINNTLKIAEREA